VLAVTVILCDLIENIYCFNLLDQESA